MPTAMILCSAGPNTIELLLSGESARALHYGTCVEELVWRDWQGARRPEMIANDMKRHVGGYGCHRNCRHVRHRAVARAALVNA